MFSEYSEDKDHYAKNTYHITPNHNRQNSKIAWLFNDLQKKNSIQNNLTHSLSWLIVKEPCDAVSPVSTFLLSWGFTSKFGLFSCLLKKLTFQSFIFNFCRHRRRRHGWWKLRYLSGFWYCWLYISSTKRKTLLYTMVYLYLVFPHKKPLEKPLGFFQILGRATIELKSLQYTY